MTTVGARRFNRSGSIPDVREAEYAARSLRTDWKLGIDPIPSVVELLEGHGIKVLSVDLTNIDGLTARARRGTAGFVSVIVVNRATCGDGTPSSDGADSRRRRQSRVA